MYLFFAYAVLALVGFGTNTLMSDAYAGLSEAGAVYWGMHPDPSKFTPVAFATAGISLVIFWNPMTLKRAYAYLIPLSIVVALCAAACTYTHSLEALRPYGFAAFILSGIVIALAAPIKSGTMTPRFVLFVPKNVCDACASAGRTMKKVRGAIERINAEQATLRWA